MVSWIQILLCFSGNFLKCIRTSSVFTCRCIHCQRRCWSWNHCWICSVQHSVRYRNLRSTRGAGKLHLAVSKKIIQTTFMSMQRRWTFDWSEWMFANCALAVSTGTKWTSACFKIVGEFSVLWSCCRTFVCRGPPSRIPINNMMQSVFPLCCVQSGQKAGISWWIAIIWQQRQHANLSFYRLPCCGHTHVLYALRRQRWWLFAWQTFGIWSALGIMTAWWTYYCGRTTLTTCWPTGSKSEFPFSKEISATSLAKRSSTLNLSKSHVLWRFKLSAMLIQNAFGSSLRHWHWHKYRHEWHLLACWVSPVRTWQLLCSRESFEELSMAKNLTQRDIYFHVHKKH